MNIASTLFTKQIKLAWYNQHNFAFKNVKIIRQMI